MTYHENLRHLRKKPSRLRRERNRRIAWGLRRPKRRLVLTDAGLYAIAFAIACLLVGIGYVVFGMWSS